RERHVERCEDELGAEMVGHRPADHAAAPGVEDDRQVPRDSSCTTWMSLVSFSSSTARAERNRGSSIPIPEPSSTAALANTSRRALGAAVG
ncbi:MAG TPA: hypothetical protein VFU21_22335, partial [Kofleriaceae bacterium]|nr:hypothetical protein [Kofleriaceae bacterium]